MKPKLTKIWIIDNRNRKPHTSDGLLAIRADFDNDRHYESAISYPYDRDAVAFALHRMAVTIGSDPLLVPNTI